MAKPVYRDQQQRDTVLHIVRFLLNLRDEDRQVMLSEETLKLAFGNYCALVSPSVLRDGTGTYTQRT